MSKKKARMNFCKFFIEKYANKNEKYIYNIITGDEIWLKFWDPKVGNNAKICQYKGCDPVETRIKSIKDKKIKVLTLFTKNGIK